MADLVVVGGGVAGVSTALRAAQAGMRVVVFDRGPAFAASAAAAGMVVPVPAAFARSFFTQGAAVFGRLLDLCAEQVPALRGGGWRSGPPWSPRPHLHLALSAREEVAGGQLQEALIERGLDAPLLGPRDFRPHVEFRAAPSVRGALLMPGGAAVDPVWLLQAWADMARDYGAVFATGVTVAEIRSDGGDRRATVVTDAGLFRAGAVVVAAGHRTPELVPEAALWATTATAQMIAYAPRRPGVLNALVTSSLTDNGEYLYQLPSGKILVGGCRSDLDTGPAAVPGGRTQVALEGVIPSLFSDFIPPPVTHRWAGPLTQTADGFPVVDRVRPRVWVNTAQADGLSYAFGIAGGLVRALLGDDPEQLDALFRTTRLRP